MLIAWFPDGSDPGLASWTSEVQKYDHHAHARPQEEVSRVNAERFVALVEAGIVEPVKSDGLEVVVVCLGQGHVVEDDGEEDDEQGDGEIVPLDAEEVLPVDAE
jgi:hypothetical protein